MARLCVVSFRLGGTDGVSIEAQKWIDAFRALGHDARTVAGEGVADVVLKGLAMDATSAPTFDELTEALSDCDLVVVENLASLPLNVAARDVLYEVLHGRRALFRHHDLAWQRPHLAHLEGPRDEARWFHVAINELSRRQLRARGIEAVTIMNAFDCAPALGRRDDTRRALDVGGQRLVLMPTRALARKNIQGALALCGALDADFWLLGPAEDGYEATLDALLEATGVRVRRGLPLATTMDDAYAASDLVVMSSTWEGFGNPVLESVTHRRALARYPYPVALEIESYGFRFFGLNDVEALSTFLDEGDEVLLERNLDVAREHFNIAQLPERLGSLLRSMGLS